MNIFLKLFLHELLYELIDSIDWKCCTRHRLTYPVIKNGSNKYNKYFCNIRFRFRLRLILRLRLRLKLRL
jgi:hypothetical protein